MMCAPLCHEVGGKLSAHVVRALRAEAGAFLCGVRLGSLRGRWWGCWLCFL